MHADFQGVGLYPHCSQSLPQRFKASKYTGLLICCCCACVCMGVYLIRAFCTWWCEK